MNYLFICSNNPAAPAYGVYISQLIRYSRACGSYQDFLDRGLLLTKKLLNQGFFLVKLKSSLWKFYSRHHNLVDRNGISVTNDHGYILLGPKIKFYLFGIAARPTEKLAAQIILFAFQTIFIFIKKFGIARRNFDRVCWVCSGLYLFQKSIIKALDVHCIESKCLNDVEKKMVCWNERS